MTQGQPAITIRTVRDAERLAAAPVPGGKRVRYRVAGVPGLSLRTTGDGAGTWTLEYRPRGAVSDDGKRVPSRTMSIGAVPQMALADAKAKALDVKARAARGEDPAAQDRATTLAAAADARKAVRLDREAETMDDAVTRYLDHLTRRQPPVSAHHLASEGYRLRNLTKRTGWKGRKLVSITATEIEDALADRRITPPASGSSLYGALRRLMLFAYHRTGRVNPILDVKQPTPPRSRERVLTPRETRQLWHAAGDRLPPRRAALVRLLMALPARRGELLDARWGDISLPDRLWTRPKTKATGRHVLPLSTLAVELLGTLRALDAPRDDRARVVAPMFGADKITSLTHTVEALEGVLSSPWVLHDLRRTCRTALAEAGVPDAVGEELLAHVRPGVLGIYNRATLAEHCAEAIELWAGMVRHALANAEAADTWAGVARKVRAERDAAAAAAAANGPRLRLVGA